MRLETGDTAYGGAMSSYVEKLMEPLRSKAFLHSRLKPDSFS